MGDHEPTAVATSGRHPPQWGRNLGMRPLSINPNQCPFRETSRITIRSDHRSVLSPRICVHLCKSVACSSDAWKSTTDSHRFTQIVFVACEGGAYARFTWSPMGAIRERIYKTWFVGQTVVCAQSRLGWLQLLWAIVRGGDNRSSSDPVTLSGGCLGCATTNY